MKVTLCICYEHLFLSARALAAAIGGSMCEQLPVTVVRQSLPTAMLSGRPDLFSNIMPSLVMSCRGFCVCTQ